MEKNKKCKTKFLFKISFCFALLLIVFLLPISSSESLAVGENTSQAEEKVHYLSESDFNKAYRVQYDQIRYDKVNGGSKISVKVEGAYYEFDKGIWAHAYSDIVYNLTNAGNYDYFKAYIGLNKTAASSSNGVIFKIYLSTEETGENWTQVTNLNSSVTKPGENATLVEIPITGAKRIRLVADSNGSNGNDHSVYADAKLTKKGYEEPGEELVPSIEELDTIIKTKYQNADASTNKEYEKVLLKRELINRVGNYALRRFLSEGEVIQDGEKSYTTNEATYRWLIDDLDTLRLYVLGGKPDGGSYYNSLTQLSKLYNAKYVEISRDENGKVIDIKDLTEVEGSSIKNLKDDFEDETPTNNKWYPGLTKGDVYKKMAISLSLTHSTSVGYWAQINHPSNRSDALERYKIFKYLYDTGRLIVSKNADGTPKQDHTPWFEALQVEEMRYVMNSIVDDEELIWLNEYTQKRIDAHPGREETYLQPHTYIAYVWPNFQNPIFHDRAKKTYWDNLFEGIFSKYNVTYSYDKEDTGMVYKAWMSMRNEYGTGAVCGGISKLGTHIRAAHGTPASVISQPGHAAIIYYRKDANGYGYWSMDNDVSGWAQSGKTEKLNTRMPLGWGNDSYVSGWPATYIMLSQEALNDYENYEKAEEIMMTVDLYTDKSKKEEIYRSALEVQPININAWYGLIKLYTADSTKTEKEWYDLAKELSDNLECFPLPMYNLQNLIKPKLTSVEYSFKFTLLQTSSLTNGSNMQASGNYVPGKAGNVFSPSVTRTVAKYLLGQVDKSLSTFSFDGENAGKIVLSSRYDNVGVSWDYCLGGEEKALAGKSTDWKKVSFDADSEHKWQLTQEEINSITAENDIYIHIVGTNYSRENLYKIDISNAVTPTNLFNNDLENRVVGANLTMEWRMQGTNEWTSYRVASPDLTGDATVEVRVGATGTYLPSEYVSLSYTANEQPNTRKYIPVSHISLVGASTQATSHGGAAANALDANYNTRWHSAWDGTDKQRYITVKLDAPVYLSAVEFVPAGGGNGKIYDGTVWGSTDGENWEILSQVTNLKYSNAADTNAQAIDNTKSFEIQNPKRVQYVKIVADRTNGNWFTARAFNFFQDLTKNPHPTAGIAYSTTEPTNGKVVARLVNPSTQITITNNNGSDTYVFTKNGEFTFTFKDASGNIGSATAKVDWIDKDSPVADVEYKIDDNKLVILLDGINEDVYILDENDNKINYVEVEKGKIVSVTYLDDLGDVYKIAYVNEEGITRRISYKNTTGELEKVAEYVVTLNTTEGEDLGKVIKEEYLDSNGEAVDLGSINATTEQINKLKALQQTARSNPLEFALEESGDYEFKLLDKANNIAYKSIKVDYIENDTIILASDVTYDVTKATSGNVVATIRPYIIDTNNTQSNIEAQILNTTGVDIKTENGITKGSYTFEDNGSFTFSYKASTDTNNWEVKSHVAKVNWIDRVNPTAEVTYSTLGSTSDPVVATLVNESEEIILTNNGANREYTFTKNGEFTFEFEDKAGNKGTAVAKVTWIREEGEEPSDYKLGDVTGDGKITGTDLLWLERHLVSLNKPEWVLKGDNYNAGDLNKDGNITATDLLLMQRLVLKEMYGK